MITPIPEKNGFMEVRLNSPRGKFKRTNMAPDQVDPYRVTPGDIPGAGFSQEEMGKLTVAQVTFWLKCLSINQNGSKMELLDRCTSSSFARSISSLCCLFSTTSVHGSLDTCFHT